MIDSTIKSAYISSRRKQSGGTLFFVLFFMVAVVAVIVTGIAVGNVFRAQGIMQNDTDSFALQSAVKLNANHYAGRLNLLTGYSRELVFDSRQLYNKTRAQAPELQGLANKLLDESRDGGRTMEQEHNIFGGYLVQTLSDEAKKFTKAESGSSGAGLVGAEIGNRQIVNLEVGDIEGMPSNTPLPTGNTALMSYDNAMGYGQPGTNLYRANTSLKLPQEDSDIKFELSSLPSSRLNNEPPATVYKAGAFHRRAYLWKDGQMSVVSGTIIPSAILCTYAAGVELKQNGNRRILVDSAAATNGTDARSQL